AIQQRLTGLGYLVCGVIHNSEVLPAQMMALRPDLIVMDMVFQPSMAGGESVLSPLTALTTPVVYVTNLGDSVSVPLSMNEAVHCVRTTSDDRELQSAITMALYRHQAETKLRKMERWLAATLNSVGDAVLAVDIEGLVTYLNPSAELLTGWTIYEAAGRPVSEVFTTLRRDSHALVENPVARVLEEGVVIELAEGTLLQRRNGSTFPIDDSAAPIRNEQGEVTGVVIIFRDDTKHQQLEEQLRETQKLEGVGRLAGGIAHDFNNLLTVINGCSALLHHSMAPDDAHRTTVEMIQQAGDRAAVLTQQLLAFSRRQVLAPKILNLNAVVTTIDLLLRSLLGEKVELITLFEPTLGHVKVDPGQMEQVIMNLAVNARDAMPDGGRLTIETRNIAADGHNAAEGESEPGPSVLLMVSDTGEGMDAETKKHLYDPFFTTKAIGKGTGLGLSMVYGIIQQSGGRITFSSERGSGTTFSIYLPRVASDGILPISPSTAATMFGGAETILVVEDDDLVRKMVRSILEMGHYVVLDARDGEEAMRLAEGTTSTIHLLITDVMMPGMNGKEVARYLLTACPNVKVLFISGYTQGMIGHDGNGILESGMQFLQKPFSPTALLSKVRELLDSKAPLP
ncbi:MAG: response regulator, partial [Nitrospira sp.]